MENQSFENLFSMFMKHMEDLIEQRVNEKLKVFVQKTTEAPKAFYSLKEVSHLTGITFLGLKGRQKRGTLKCVNEGNVVLVPKSEVERLLDKLKRQLKR